jgi:POT family proton-dependent oligopeptide transporter
MLFGVLQYVRGQKTLGDAGAPPREPATTRDWLVLKVGVGLTLAVVLGIVFLTQSGQLTVDGIDRSFGIFLTLITVGFFARLFLSAQWSPAERKCLLAILVYFLASCLFWSAFEQAGSTLNLFAENHTRETLFGIEFPAGWYQNVNSIGTIVASPLFALLWLKLGKRDPSHPVKFALGLLFAGLGFLVMERGAATAESGALRVSGSFLIVTYLCHSIGEVCLSPVGLSAMTRLAPQRVGALMMGVWFLSISVGSYLGGQIAHAYEGLSERGLYTTIAAITIGAALVMVLLVRPMQRLSAARE